MLHPLAVGYQMGAIGSRTGKSGVSSTGQNIPQENFDIKVRKWTNQLRLVKGSWTNQRQLGHIIGSHNLGGGEGLH